MRHYLDRRQFLVGAGVGAIGTAAAVATAPTAVFADNEKVGIEGTWLVTVHVASPSGVADFDTTYGFAHGGVFTRIDGRTNAPSLGTWTRGEDGAILTTARVFHLTAGVRDATIWLHFAAHVVDGMLTGDWTAVAHSLSGTPITIPGFPASGTIKGTRIPGEGP
jgi:hypothetical protein